MNITITSSAALGCPSGRDDDRQSRPREKVGGFTVLAGIPRLTSINPVAGTQGTNATLVLNGSFTNFTQGPTTASLGSGIAVGTVTVNGPELASVPISIGDDAVIGPRDVTVVTGAEVVTLTNGFTVLQGAAGSHDHQSQRRTARRHAECVDHRPVHELAERLHARQLRTRDHGQLEQRFRTNAVDDEYHDRCGHHARSARCDCDDEQPGADGLRRVHGERRRRDGAVDPHRESELRFDGCAAERRAGHRVERTARSGVGQHRQHPVVRLLHRPIRAGDGDARRDRTCRDVPSEPVARREPGLLPVCRVLHGHHGRRREQLLLRLRRHLLHRLYNRNDRAGARDEQPAERRHRHRPERDGVAAVRPSASTPRLARPACRFGRAARTWREATVSRMRCGG